MAKRRVIFLGDISNQEEKEVHADEDVDLFCVE
jgi:hypothetical protein